MTPSPSSVRPSHIATVLRQHAVASVRKQASAGDPETQTHGDGVVSNSSATPKTDPGTASVTDAMPNNGTIATATPTSGSPDRLTTADGQGGITQTAAQPKPDPNLEGVRADMPTNADGNKQAGLSARVLSLRQAINQASGKTAQAAAAPVAAVPATPGANGQQKVAASEDEFPADILAKMASDALGTEAGLAFYSNFYEVRDGEKAASDRVAMALQASRALSEVEMAKSAAINSGLSRAEDIYQSISGLISEADADEILKQASVHEAAFNSFDSPLLKFAYAEGMDTAAAEDVAAETAGAAGGEPPAAEGEGGPMPQEELLAALQEMINSGEITPEELAQALAEIEAGGAATPDAAASPDAAMAASPDAAMAAAPPAPDAASAVPAGV